MPDLAAAVRLRPHPARERARPLSGPWTQLLAAAAVAGTALAVVSGAAGWGTAHRLLAGLALPPLTGLAVIAWLSVRRLLPLSLASLALFGVAALLTAPDLHLATASLAFAATSLLGFRCLAPRPDARWSVSAARDYVTLTKPRVMSLLLLTGGAAIFVGAAGLPSARVLALTVLGLALACGGAGALNHYYDRDIDRLMGSRTASRPVAAGRIGADQALAFGVALSAFSFVLLDSLVNLPTALLALGGNLFYVLVYTRWLKRSTPQNIVIGGAAGAMPPLVGYAGASGHLGWAALAMFVIVFLWTPPHFWALALMLQEHYARARVPMLPVLRGERETARQILWYTAAMIAATLVPVAFGVFGLVYAAAAAVLGALFAWWSFELWRGTTRRHAVRLFHYSLLYLALLFAAMALDAVA